MLAEHTDLHQCCGAAHAQPHAGGTPGLPEDIQPRVLESAVPRGTYTEADPWSLSALDCQALCRLHEIGSASLFSRQKHI